MKRLTLIIVGIGAWVSLAGQGVYAQGSEFARITPETEQEHGVHVVILPVQGQNNTFKVIPPVPGEGRNCYLISCREKVPPEKQDFRDYVWSMNSAQRFPPPGRWSHIFSITPLPSKPAAIILDRFLLQRSYIYLDVPPEIGDGGLYYCVDLPAYPLPEDRRMVVRYSPAIGLGPEKGVMRRDPSDIIRTREIRYDGNLVDIRTTYYVWYTKSHVSHGYDATVWYATSTDGHTWVEKGEALPRGPEGSWDAQSVFTPNILVANKKYWLFYTAVPKPFNNKGNKVTKSAIGIAVADSPDGPWKKLAANPVLRCSEDPNHFDSMRVDDACLIVREGKYWLYYKGRQWNNTPANTKMGVAIAEKPEGPYRKYSRQPIIRGGHEVLVWPFGTGVVAMLNIGPEGIRRTLQYAPDGLNFSKMQDLKAVPRAPGAYRPEAFTESGKGRMIEWGIHIGYKKGYLPFLERFDCQWER